MTQQEVWEEACKILKDTNVIVYSYNGRCCIAPAPGTFNAHVVYASCDTWEEALERCRVHMNTYYHPTEHITGSI